MLNIYGSAKRSVFYIIHGCYYKLLQEGSFSTIVLYHRKYYWLLICMLNLVLLICIYSYLTSCTLCSFDLNRLDRWIALGSKNYANQCPATLGTRVFFSRATGSFVSSAAGWHVSRGSLFKTWPKPETTHEKPLAPRVMSCLSVPVRVWHWEFVVHNNIDAVCHPRCLRSKYV